ncbi:PHD-like zinc-binding domain containing protein [Novymonas esmeraldas]|uniref:PHD-like zinc-binding domain containing protein n=1 Tax=Novymonas esmeraldas TaxID=1808958 RepID=A0AAW0F3S6_9TRYP
MPRVTSAAKQVHFAPATRATAPDSDTSPEASKLGGVRHADVLSRVQQLAETPTLQSSGRSLNSEAPTYTSPHPTLLLGTAAAAPCFVVRDKDSDAATQDSAAEVSSPPDTADSALTEDDAYVASVTVTAATPRAPPPPATDTPPTLSQLVAAVDDVLGHSPRTPQCALAASPFATAPTNACAAEPAAVQAPSASCAGVAARTADPDTSLGGAPEPRCVFCGTSAWPAPVEGTPSPLCSADGVVYHTACALWCPEVFFDATTNTLCGVAEAAERARCIRCACCRRPGAAVGCACPSCPLSVHIPCAVAAGMLVDATAFVVYCPAHRPGQGRAATQAKRAKHE